MDKMARIKNKEDLGVWGRIGYQFGLTAWGYTPKKNQKETDFERPNLSVAAKRVSIFRYANSSKCQVDFIGQDTYHVYNRTNNQERLFLSDEDKFTFLNKYDSISRLYWILMAGLCFPIIFIFLRGLNPMLNGTGCQGFFGVELVVLAYSSIHGAYGDFEGGSI